MSKFPSIIGEIASGLGTTKVSYSRLMKVYKQAVSDGFDDDDFRQALRGMQKSDKRYWSIYSLFMKTDYWMSQGKEEEQKFTKGVWFND